jgi:hypothetical protein
MNRPDYEPSRSSTDVPDTIVLDNDTLADVQRGYYKKPEFFGNMATSSSFDLFKAGLDAASNYTGWLSGSLVSERKPDYVQWALTVDEYDAIVRRSENIAAYGYTPLQTVINFLIILCSIDRIEDMEKIAVAIDLYDLIDIDILRQPYEILEVRNLEKIAYMASALDALINMFARFLGVSNFADSKPESISNLLSNVSSILGGLSGAAGIAERLANSGSSDAMGNYLSELLTGKRIPMNVIAKNPMKQSPSYIGQAMFGEAPTSLAMLDINELFPKKIGVFPMPSNGAGVSAFGIQNFSSLQGSMNISSAINKLMFGGSSVDTGSFTESLIATTVSKLKVMTGVSDTETFSLNSSDVAIPLMISMSTVNAGLDKSPFDTSTFSNAWTLANSVSNFMQSRNSGFLKAIRTIS